jgi:hypothetical protein
MADDGVLDKFFTKVMADVLTSSRVRWLRRVCLCTG